MVNALFLARYHRKIKITTKSNTYKLLYLLIILYVFDFIDIFV